MFDIDQMTTFELIRECHKRQWLAFFASINKDASEWEVDLIEDDIDKIRKELAWREAVQLDELAAKGLKFLFPVEELPF